MIKIRPGTPYDYAGWILIAWLVYRTVTFYFFPYKQPLLRYRRQPRAYALVTAGSGGIGFACAQELVSHGFGVILLSSNKDKLLTAANRLKTRHPDTDVKTIAFDARKKNDPELLSLVTPLLDLPITVLINCVGLVTLEPKYQPFTSNTTQDVDDMFNANARFMTELTRILLPTLIRNGPSTVLNIGSGAQFGMPRLMLYSAVKAYVTSFAVALAREAKMEGWKVDSFGVLVGEVRSERNTVAIGPGSPPAEQYAKVLLDRVEMAADRQMWLMSPYWLHALQIKLIQSIPEWLLQFMLEKQTRIKGEAVNKIK